MTDNKSKQANTVQADVFSKPYAPWLKGWRVNLLGPKPGEPEFMTVTGCGYRPGSKNGMALAMMLRTVDGDYYGATSPEVVMCVGSQQLVRAEQLHKAGVLVRHDIAPRSGALVRAYSLPAAKATKAAKRAAGKGGNGKAASKAKPAAADDSQPATGKADSEAATQA